MRQTFSRLSNLEGTTNFNAVSVWSSIFRRFLSIFGIFFAEKVKQILSLSKKVKDLTQVDIEGFTNGRFYPPVSLLTPPRHPGAQRSPALNFGQMKL